MLLIVEFYRLITKHKNLIVILAAGAEDGKTYL